MWHIYEALKCPNKVDQGKQCFFALFLDAQASLAPVFLPGLSIYQALRVSCLWLVRKSQQRNICHPGEKVSETNYEKCFRISLLQCTAVAQQRRQQNARCLCYFIKKMGFTYFGTWLQLSHCERVGHIKGIWQHQDSSDNHFFIPPHRFLLTIALIRCAAVPQDLRISFDFLNGFCKSFIYQFLSLNVFTCFPHKLCQMKVTRLLEVGVLRRRIRVIRE